MTTVLGNIDVRSLGRTNYHEHLLQITPLLPKPSWFATRAAISALPPGQRIAEVRETLRNLPRSAEED